MAYLWNMPQDTFWISLANMRLKKFESTRGIHAEHIGKILVTSSTFQHRANSKCPWDLILSCCSSRSCWRNSRYPRKWIHCIATGEYNIHISNYIVWLQFDYLVPPFPSWIRSSDGFALLPNTWGNWHYGPARKLPSMSYNSFKPSTLFSHWADSFSL